MVRILTSVFALWLSLGTVATVWGSETPQSNFSVKKVTDAVKKALPSAVSTPSNQDAKREAMRKKIDEKRKELNGSEWNVDLSSGGKALQKDTLTFQNNQVKSKFLSEMGYSASNYSITVPEGSDMSVWETMQTGAKGNICFMRADWNEGRMQGVISEQLEEGKSKDYEFNGLNKIVVPPTTKTEEKVKTAMEDVDDEAAVAAFVPGTTDELTDKNI